MSRTRTGTVASIGAIVAMSAAVYFYSGARTPPTSRTSHAWLNGVARAALGTADAAACVVDGKKVRRIEQIWEPRKSTSGYGSEEWFICTWDGSGSDPVADAIYSTVYEPNTVTTFCDGTFKETIGAGNGNRVCKSPHANCDGKPPFSNAFSGLYCVDSPPGEVSLTCQTSDCPEPEPCCKDDETDCRSCGGNPVSLVGGAVSEPIGQGALFYKLQVADLPVGFTPLRIFLYSQSTHESTNFGGPIGIRASHSLAPALFYREGKIKVTTEEGGFFNFTLAGSLWTADNGRVATLVVQNGGACTGTMLLTLGNGTKYTFSETGPSPCTGTAIAEGRIQQIVRANGETLTFTPDANGYPSVVENRLGERVTLVHGPEGTLEQIEIRKSSSAAPYSTFRIFYDGGHLGAVTTSSGTGTLFNLEYKLQTANNRALKKITNSAGTRLAEWTYVNDGFDTRILTEKGRGDATTGNDELSFTYDVANGLSTIGFTDSLGVLRQNQSAYVPGARPRVSDRTNAGSCPGCGTTDKVAYVSTARPSARENANAFVDTFSNHDSLGNPQTIRKGCDGTVGSPSCTNGSFRELSYLYQPSTRVVKEATRPSAGGGTVTDRRTFDGGSTRVLLDKKEGKTAASLGDLLNTTKTLATKTTWCKDVPGECPAANDLDVRRVEGPYDGTLGSPPADSPEVEYAYYSATDADCGTGGVLAANTNRVKTITRWVTPSRSLVTKYCRYSESGKPTKIVAPSNITTTLVFGNGSTQSPTQVTLDDGGLPLTTDFQHDAEGRVTAVKLPRTNASGNRVGFAYTLDAAARVVEIRQGQFTSGTWSIANPVQKLIFLYDAWGNRIKTRWIDSAGVDRVTEGAQYDSFNRLACVVRPYASNCADPATTQKTTYEYDPEGALIAVRDAQNDEILYGSLATFSKQNRYGQIEKTQQSACNHPVGSENSACAVPTPTPATVAYEYDAALQLKRVTISDAIRNGQMVTDYVEDDFGKLLKISSPDGGNSLFFYDAFGRLFESQDARQAAAGFKIRYSYDRLNRLTLTEKVAGANTTPLVKFCYDGFDAYCGFTDSQFAFNRGRLSSVDDGAGKIKYENDRYGRLVREDRTWNSGAAYTTRYSYDANGNLTATTLPHGVVLGRSYNDADQPSAVTYSPPGLAAQPLVGTISWHPFGGIDNWYRLTSSTPRWWVVRDSAGRVIETKMTGSHVLFSDTYGYANDGNVLRSPASENPPRLLHDSLGRLQQDRFGTSSTQAYAYDHAGNRTIRVAGTTTQASSWETPTPPSTLTNKLDKVSWSLNNKIEITHDVSGNVVNRDTFLNNQLSSPVALAYSDEGLVSSVTTGSGTTSYVRDYRGLRLQKSGAGGIGNFTFDPSGQLIGWQGPSSRTTCGGLGVKTIVPHETYLWLDGRPIAIIKTHTETGCSDAFVVDGVFYYYTEKMGLPRVVTKVTGIPATPQTVWGPATWDAFANPLTTIAEDPDADGNLFTVPFRLPGQFALGTLEGGPTTSQGGLHDNWFRVYDSQTGRYLQPDPVFSDTRRSPFHYANDSPLRYADFHGTQVVETAVVAGATVGAVEIAAVTVLVAAAHVAIVCYVDPDICRSLMPEDGPKDLPKDKTQEAQPIPKPTALPPGVDPPYEPNEIYGCYFQCENDEFPAQACDLGRDGGTVMWRGAGHYPVASDPIAAKRICDRQASQILASWPEIWQLARTISGTVANPPPTRCYGDDAPWWTIAR